MEGLDDLVAGAGAPSRRDRSRCRPASGRGARARRGRPPRPRTRRARGPRTSPRRRHVEEDQEDGEEEERRAQVALDDDDREGDGPHRDHRREVRQGRQPERPHPRGLLDEEGPVLRQVAGQEDDQDHLQELRRLAAERPDGEGQALAVDLAPGNEGEQQEPHAEGRPRVLVEAQPGVAPDRRRPP